jgi:antitoxin HicB
MALTRDFKETILARVQRDPKFRSALLKQGIEALLAGDVDTGKSILRDRVASPARRGTPAMNDIALSDAKNRLSELIRRVESGEEIAITRRGKVVARLVPALPPQAGQRALDAVAHLRVVRKGVSLGRLSSRELMREGRHHGSSLDSFLKEEGAFEEAQALAIKEVVVWQLMDAMEKGDMSKARLAILLKTSRSQVDRLLDPTRDLTLSTLQRAAALVGRKVQIELV